MILEKHLGTYLSLFLPMLGTENFHIFCVVDDYLESLLLFR